MAFMIVFEFKLRKEMNTRTCQPIQYIHISSSMHVHVHSYICLNLFPALKGCKIFKSHRFHSPLPVLICKGLFANFLRYGILKTS